MKSILFSFRSFLFTFVLLFNFLSLNTHAHNAYEPDIGGDAAGNIVAVYITMDDQGVFRIESSIYTALTGTWSTPTVISTNSLISSLPRLVVNANGDAVAVWAAYDPITFSPVIIAAIYTNGVWGPEVNISSNAFYSFLSNDSQIRLDNDGNITIVYTSIENSTGHAQIHAVHGTVAGALQLLLS